MREGGVYCDIGFDEPHVHSFSLEGALREWRVYALISSLDAVQKTNWSGFALAEETMGVLTTTIGAYPKPDYLDLPDWWRDSREGEYYTFNYVDDYEAAVVRLGEEL